MGRPAIGLADLFMAFDALGPGGADDVRLVAAVARALGAGFGVGADGYRRPPDPGEPAVADDVTRLAPPSDLRDRAPMARARVTEPADPALGDVLECAWWEIAYPPVGLVADPSAGLVADREMPPPADNPPGPRWPDPLLPPGRTPALLGAALGRDVAGDDLDLPRVVDAIARRRIPPTLPRVTRRSVAARVQILVDLGVGMEPFATDQRDLIEAVERFAGAAAVEVLAFRDNPLRAAGVGPPLWWQPYEPPAADTTVLIASDLGMSGGSDRGPTEDSWLAFARLLALAGVPAVAFVPLPPHRWSPRLARALPMCGWDRTASVAGLRSTLRWHAVPAWERW